MLERVHSEGLGTGPLRSVPENHLTMGLGQMDVETIGKNGDIERLEAVSREPWNTKGRR